MRQALRCVENNLYRASHILAWTALVDLIQNILRSDSFKKLNAVKTNWKITSLEQLQDEINEFQLIEACKDVKLVSEPEMRMLQGFSSKRNLCAHPSDFLPDFNQTVGYMADTLSMIKKIQIKGYCSISQGLFFGFLILEINRKGKRECLNDSLTYSLIKSLNGYFQTKVEIPRIRVGKK